jgi:alkanesulfonate monooxygenase SsuD/methylene tetrahydromethanopterin reductase-like flavin-dependent oxidoreductase (luciferase family)
MKFQLVINMERLTPQTDMREVERHTLEMVQMAEEGGFEIAWASEHHALELSVAPNPFLMLTWWAAHTSRIRLGTAVVVAPYWNPIRLAGEAALFDLYSNGRLEFGIGSGAYQREFDRMAPSVKQSDGYLYMQELLPAVQALWKGDYAHDGKYWSFPTATSTPKPVQKEVPIWIAARAPATYDWAIENHCNIMSWALSRPFAEVETYMERFETALRNHPGARRPIFSTMRYTSVYERADEADIPLDAAVRQTGRFENLFKNLGGVHEGFAEEIDLTALNSRAEFDREAMRENLIFGTPDQVIAKLKPYEALGVDQFIYCTSFGLGMKEQKKSLKLFIKGVMPAFEAQSPAYATA